MPEHVVAQGDCVLSIAKAHGASWQSLWDHPQNRGLRSLRRVPNVLRAGDVVFVPPATPKVVVAATGDRHRFSVERPRARIKVRLLHDGQPRADVPYRFTVGGETREGRTDGDGLVDELVPVGAAEAELAIDPHERYRLAVGHLDPVDTPAGQRARLRHLGFHAGARDEDAALRAALRRFQTARSLEATGEADDATLDALRDAHGS